MQFRCYLESPRDRSVTYYAGEARLDDGRKAYLVVQRYVSPDGSPAPLPLGRYQHYKQKSYLVIGTAFSLECEPIEYTVYVPLYEHDGPAIALREIHEFCGTVTLESGREVKRFTFVG